MELKEISASNVTPYRCYVRGNIIQTEGENVHTIGFKDGIAVVQVIPTVIDMQNSSDNKAIDLTKLKKVVVKTDPKSGKKFIYQDGRKIEILPQISLGLNKLTATQAGPPSDIPKRNIIIQAPINIIQGQLPRLVPTGTLPKLIPTGTLPKLVPTTSGLNMKLFDNIKYQVVTTQKTGEGTPSGESPKTVDNTSQTDSSNMESVSIQTEPCLSGFDSLVSESFIKSILGSDFYSETTPMRMFDPKKIKTKEDIQKFNFFSDLRKALNFDLSGNLPLHDSVMQNNIKTVMKNCIILRAIRESVNILNQQSYAPLHLAILHHVDIEIIKILLNNGADPGIADPDGNTAIHLAIEHGRLATLKLLIKKAKEINLNLDIFNYEGFTPLILACLNHSYPAAELLLANGADPNIKDQKSGRTALFHAAEAHDVNLVELLMQNKADTKIRNFFGTSPHDAMFELDDMPIKIRLTILGRDHTKFQNKKKLESSDGEPSVKKQKFETTPVLKRLAGGELTVQSRKVGFA